MRYLRALMRNLNFRKKITFICLAIGLIPIALLGTYSYAQMRHLLVERENTVLKESLKQEVRSLDNKLKSYLTTINYIAWNDGISSSLSKKYEDNFAMYMVYRDVIDPMLSTILSLDSTIDSVTIYSDNPIYPHYYTLRPLYEVVNSTWYTHAINNTAPFFTTSKDGHTLLLISQMHSEYSPYSNIICMSIDADSFFYPLTKIFSESYGVMLLNKTGDVVFQYADYRDLRYDYALTPQELESEALEGSKASDYVIEKAPLSYAPWDIYLYRPVKTVSAPANQITLTVMLIISVCFVIILLFSILLSKAVVSPIEALSDNMKLIEQGELSITVEQTSSDEIGRLVQSFRHMVERLKYLINEVLREKIMQQEYEMKALQAQINPHFLYNSLSLINGKAIIAGQDDISQMAQLLSSFYRTSLNKGKNLICVKDELENAYSYAKIQQIMHSDSFDIVYDVDENVYSIAVPNLLLQPLVENAIFHGIDHKETPGRGVITISCHQKGQLLIFEVSDNGCGMSAEQCEIILTSESSGYGIKNVHRRVQLYYGPEYGLHYTSTKGVGTHVTLTLPAIDPDKERQFNRETGG